MAITKVSPGLLDLDSGITITTSDNTAQLTLLSTDADAAVGPILDLYRNSSSPADDDFLGKINFKGRNDNSQDVDYGYLAYYISDASDGTEDAFMQIGMMKGGSNHLMMEVGASEIVFNQGSVDIDFRVESDGNANMLFVDGGNNSVMIGGTALASGQRFAVNVINADSSTNEPVVFNNETHSAANAYGILIKYSGSSGNWSSGTGQNFIRCTDDGEANQKFAVTGAGQVQAQTGIAFGGDTATANTLDDYEEGTWTPDISGSSSTSGVGYAVRDGHYTKIGNMVTANFSITFNDKGSMSGTTRITGLPFSGNNSPQQQSCSMQTANMNVDKDQTVVAIQYAVNALAYLYVQESGLALSQISGNSQYTDTSQFIGSLTYFTDS